MITRIHRSNTLLLRLGVILIAGAAIPGLALTLPGDPADGEIRADTGTVDTDDEEMVTGHGGVDASELSSVVYFFPLPEVTGSDILNATMLFSYTDKSGSFITNPASADVYGLGYVATPTIDPSWHYLGPADTRTGNELGTGIKANPIVKIGDDIVSPNSGDPNGAPFRLALPDPEVAAFLRLLYDEGAVAGDYAVIRINVDESASTANRTVKLASADDPIEGQRPQIRINENTTLLFDPFDDGDRLDGDDPLDTDWWTTTGDLDLLVEDDSAGLGSGDALSVGMWDEARRFLGGFPGITLEAPGDFIRMEIPFRAISFEGVNEAFRMGLYDSAGAPLNRDTTSSGDVASYKGYLARMSTGGASDSLSLIGDTPGNLLGGSGTDFLSRDETAGSINDFDPHVLVLTVTRTSAEGITARVQMDDVVLIGEDPGGNNADGEVYFTFNAVAMGATPRPELVDFYADNILVETSASPVDEVPYTLVETEALELQFEAQPGTRYGLEQTASLTAADWADTGYTVTGDGGVLRIYDPEGVDMNRSYRLVEAP